MTRHAILRAAAASAVTLALSAPALAAQRSTQSCPATTGATMPLRYKGGPTVAAITPCDLMTRLYIYAADSMRGREAGTPDAMRATVYIGSQVRRLGLKPGGDNGTYFQALSVTARSLSPSSTITVGGATYHPGAAFVVPFGVANRSASGQAIYGGVMGDTANELTAEQAKGRIVVMSEPAGATGGRFGRGRGANNPLAEAAAIVTVSSRLPAARTQYVLNDTVQQEGQRAYAAAHPNPNGNARGRGGFGVGGAVSVTVTPRVAAAMLGKSVASAKLGDAGKQVSIDLKEQNVAAPTRNVIAILPGSDPVLKNEYVVIGAHADHIGVSRNQPVVEHDSLKAYNEVARIEGADTRNAPPPTAEQWARINEIKDSLRKIYPPRLDSISNGADDDGSGSVSVLELAEAFAKGNAHPKRSILFIWQMGEEKGLWGSEWFTNHPTVPRDSIVADLNMDMEGRGAPTDITGRDMQGNFLEGANNYLQLVGSRRLSTELGDIAEDVNKSEPVPFKFDYSMDANGHPQNIYCRSDHANYARYGIPVIFFTTGGHADYHQVTDEPEYIQYEHMSRVGNLVFDIANRVADLDHPVTVDKTKPDSPFARCQQ
jgi:hypothetical protein